MRPWPDRLLPAAHLALLDAALARPWQPRSDRHAFTAKIRMHISPLQHDLCISRGPISIWISQRPGLDWAERRDAADRAFGPTARRQMAALAALLTAGIEDEIGARLLPAPQILQNPSAAPLRLADPERWAATVDAWRLPDAEDVRPPVLRKIRSTIVLPPPTLSAHARLTAAQAHAALLAEAGLALD